MTVSNSRDLLLLRHGEAQDVSASGDFGRELTERGLNDARRIGRWLARANQRPEMIISSTAARALATAKACLESAGLAADDVQTDARIYNASPESLLAVLADVPAPVRSVLLVGHNPGLGYLVGALARDLGPRDDPYYQLHPATLVSLRTERTYDTLGDDCADVSARVHAGDLPG